MERNEKSKILSVQQLSQEYGIGINKAYEIIHRKGFPVVFVGKKALILRSEINQWFCENAGKIF